jgi:hypothetical protein
MTHLNINKFNSSVQRLSLARTRDSITNMIAPVYIRDRSSDSDPSTNKARFCAGGHRQIEGVDFSETFAPVVNWTTVRLLLVLSQVLNLSTKQVDYTAAFILAPINDTVYLEMPRGFSEPGMVLKLKRSLYGSPRNS